VVERFSWLLVSDIHLRKTQDTWAQSVVLQDLVRSVKERYGDGNGPLFVIVSGDLAFSGAPEEYRLVVSFLDALAAALRLPRRLFFLVSGNHDVSRRTQTTCFAGARHILNSPQKVDEFLGMADERQTLLRRLSAYLEFEAAFCKDQVREVTAEGLAYVAPLDVDGMPVCLLGLHSSWMCGGDDDKSNLLVGDRPVIDALELLRKRSPRLVLGVMHHPCDWLQEFDQRSVEERLYPACDLIHRGHLHEPVTRLVSSVPGQACVIVAAGAGYAGRNFKNSYSYVTVDLSQGKCRIETFEYDPPTNGFRPRDDVWHPIKLRGTLPGTRADLAREIRSIPEAAPHASYIAALVAGVVSEVPTKMGGKIIFAAPTFLSNSEDGELSAAAQGAFQVANLLLTFRDDVPLMERFQRVLDRISRFGASLKRIAAADVEVAAELGRREENGQALMTPAPPTPFASTADFMEELARAGEWAQLENTARKHAGSNARPLAAMARRFLVIALANQGDAAKLTEACALAQGIVNEPGCDAPDFVQAAVLLFNEKRYNDSCNLLKEFVGRYGGQIHLIREIGQKVFIETNDGELGAALGMKAVKRRGKP
jgi:predicted MPP superfamily phosphohydrolase